MDISKTLEAKSDQLNSDDLIAGDRTVTVEKVTGGSAEQPVNVHLTELPGRPYRPSKSMRRVLAAAWGKQASEWVGRRLTLYRDPTVKFGGEVVGGIKVSHMSHINGPLSIALTVTRGKKALHHVEPLVESTPEPPSLTPRIEQAVTAFSGIGVTVEQITAKLGGRATDTWTAADLDELGRIYQSISGGQATVADEFGGEVA